MVFQVSLQLPAFRRGFHLITHTIEQSIKQLPKTGIVTVFIQHTSAGITINENADPSVRDDFESFINKLIPENDPVYTHVFEGSDDMPAHLKASIIGQSITIPVKDYRLDLGTWQGIYLCEFRDRGGRRKLSITVIGE